VEEIIRVAHVSKEYRLGAIGGGTLKGDLQSFMARLRGKEYPNAKIGQNVYVQNQRFLALDDISFSIKKGERVGIIGHNGAGKSTLLKLLSRVTAPTKGTISYNGRIASMLEVGTGFHPELTGRENVYLNGAILGMTKAEITEKFDDIVRFAEMEQFIDTPVKRYSSGMYVKLAFAVAAHLDSDILVMDEVLAVGDMKFQQKCLGKMDDVSKSEGRTILYVSHNMNTVRQLCSRCIVMDHGRVVFDGDVEQGIEMYMSKRGDIGTMTFDLSDKTGKENPQTTSIKMMKLQLQGKELASYRAGELLRFKLDVLSRKTFDNIRFRFELRNLDGSPVGTSPNTPLGSMEIGEEKTFSLGFDTSWLTVGKYSADFVLFELNEYGVCRDHDLVLNTFRFEIQENSEIVWNKKNWGHIRFPEVKILGD